MTPLDPMRTLGARLALARAERHQAARHVRASRREVRRDIIREATSPANVRAVREAERDRDDRRSPAEWAALSTAVAGLQADIDAAYEPTWRAHVTKWDRVFAAEIGVAL